MRKIGWLMGLMIGIFILAKVGYDSHQKKHVEIEETSQSSVEQTEAKKVEETSQDVHALPRLPQPMPLVDTQIMDQEGQMIEMKAFRGKPMVINFWASWCPPCQEEMPDFQEVYEEYGQKVDFVMLNATNSKPSETQEVASNFIKESKYTFPIYYDIDHENQIVYSVTSLPSTLIVNSQGMVEYAIRGPLSKAGLEAALSSLD